MATYRLLVDIEVEDSPYDPDDVPGELEAALTHWLEDNWGTTDPYFKHNAITNVFVTIA